MNFRFRFPALFALLVLFSLFLNACALPHEGIIHITDPSNGNTFPLGQPITIRVHVNTAIVSNYNHLAWQYYEWNILDAGAIVAHGADPVNQDIFEFVVNSAPEGAHYISVRGRVARPDPDFADLPNNPYKVYSDWIDSNEVCFYVGPNPPSDFCTIRTIAEPLSIATITATPVPPTATATAIRPIPTHRNPNQHGGSGCSQYGNQNSCDLAGCSWNGSSCTVSP